MFLIAWKASSCELSQVNITFFSVNLRSGSDTLEICGMNLEKYLVHLKRR